jgi:hypothetical protein
MGRVKVTEHQITEIWQHQLLDKTRLITEDGELIRIIYPGRINDDQGADFRDAVIATSQGLVKGDIELHVRSSDWRAHQHHRNPAYNRVILHVVMWHDTDTATNSQDGKVIPILALHKYTKSPSAQWSDGEYPSATPNMPCFNPAEHLTLGIITEFLDRAGRERFLAKAAGFQADLAQAEASQALYQGIMGALGYCKNKLPFIELARRLPLRILQSVIHGKMSGEECLARQQTLLLGTAGLLPESKSEDLPASCPAQAMSPDAWHLFKVRPNNSPRCRIVAMSYLLLRYRQNGILEAVVNMIKEAPLNKGHLTLEQGLMVTPVLLGRNQAAAIIVNVLLPFAFAWSKDNSQPELRSKAFALYRTYPGLVVNSIERHMREQLGLNGKIVNSAQRQQGLIHIYKTLCTQGKCHCCPLGTQASLRLGTTSRPRLSTLPALRRK